MERNRGVSPRAFNKLTPLLLTGVRVQTALSTPFFHSARVSENGIGEVACVRVKPRYAPITTWTAFDVHDENAQAGGGKKNA